MFSFFKRKKEKNLDSILSSNLSKNYSFDKMEALALLNAIKQEFGLDYSKQEYITIKKLETFAKSNSIENYKILTKRYNTDNTIKKALINMLTVNESYFFRELLQVEAFLKIAQEKQNFSILSAPCATGEEVYSIAIKLQEELSDKKYTLMGIDINYEALDRAKKGKYSTRSVSKIPQNILQKYFTKKDGLYNINKYILNDIKWKHQNVFAKDFMDLGKFDYVFSRNMLIYFNNDEKKRALKQFYNILKNNLESRLDNILNSDVNDIVKELPPSYEIKAIQRRITESRKLFDNMYSKNMKDIKPLDKLVNKIENVPSIVEKGLIIGKYYNMETLEKIDEDNELITAKAKQVIDLIKNNPDIYSKQTLNVLADYFKAYAEYVTVIGLSNIAYGQFIDILYNISKLIVEGKIAGPSKTLM